MMLHAGLRPVFEPPEEPSLSTGLLTNLLADGSF